MSDEQPILRRSTHVDHEVSYASVGASQAPDLMKYPPVGSTPFEEEVLLGSGEDRFMSATSTLMTWGAQKGANIEIELVDKGQESKYASISFRDTGLPEGPKENEQLFAPDGTPYLEAGHLVNYRIGDEDVRSMRVISVIDETNRVGFIVGSAAESDIAGEAFLRVEMRSDNSVWAVARGFFYDARKGSKKLLTKSGVKKEIARVAEQLHALTPVVQATINASSSEEE
ncbi:DUF1990 family protein [Leucobacter sp. UCMA 4100]|uniref:DUF1990 family protein n=1 Tax=Leucobacter sp. UCMA 4100 TaxID=2810534 RepID=UPI0022EB8213|nr:DUF1990 family protein [Leucobacter sp. UCMA 4100]MDA3145925.1 DUF1990 family protein [Leucobacter sp. UCMA 4100]